MKIIDDYGAITEREKERLALHIRRMKFENYIRTKKVNKLGRNLTSEESTAMWQKIYRRFKKFYK